jgi:hypothetical protein
MGAVKILQQDWEIDSRLFNLLAVTRSEFFRIVFAAVSARADFQPHQPANAAGLLSYIHGTGALRDVFCPKGWELNRSGNIESVYNSASGIKIIFQNVDIACDPDHDPQAISGKGPAARKAVELGQEEMFPELEDMPERKEANAFVWYFCVNAVEATAELSRPKSIVDRQFKGFHERIFIVRPGEWADIDVSDLEEEPSPEIEVSVTRR